MFKTLAFGLFDIFDPVLLDIRLGLENVGGKLRNFIEANFARDSSSKRYKRTVTKKHSHVSD